MNQNVYLSYGNQKDGNHKDGNHKDGNHIEKRINRKVVK